jgi:hypothetical protein
MRSLAITACAVCLMMSATKVVVAQCESTDLAGTWKYTALGIITSADGRPQAVVAGDCQLAIDSDTKITAVDCGLDEVDANDLEDQNIDLEDDCSFTIGDEVNGYSGQFADENAAGIGFSDLNRLTFNLIKQPD